MTTATLDDQTLPAGRALLRMALRLDAVVTGANGAAYLAAAAPLDDLLGIPAPVLRAAGAFLLVFAAALWLLASRADPSRGAVRAVIALNVVWAVESLAVATAGWGSPTTVGTVWIVLQALVVAGFAALQAAGRRRAHARVART